MKRLFLLGTFAVAILIPGMSQTATGDATNGKRLFLRDGCYQCHGYAGQGGGAGARISAIGLNPQAMIRYVRGPAGAMPAYSDKVIGDQELTDIHAYLQTMPKPKPAKDIPLLSDSQKK